MKRNLVGKILGKIKIFVQDFVPIRTALRGGKMSKRVLVGGIKGCKYKTSSESFNEWEGRGYDDSVPGVVTKTATFQDRTARSSAWSASLP